MSFAVDGTEAAEAGNSDISNKTGGKRSNTTSVLGAAPMVATPEVAPEVKVTSRHLEGAAAKPPFFGPFSHDHRQQMHDLYHGTFGRNLAAWS